MRTQSVVSISWAVRVIPVVFLVSSVSARPPGYTEFGPPQSGLVPVPNSQSMNTAAASAGWDSVGVNLLSRVPLSEFNGGSPVGTNDVWGYTSPSGREYAIVGLTTGTGFVEVTDPTNPVLVGEIDDAPSTWSDMAVYDQYAYNVNESSNGLQVINLTQIDNGVVNLVREVNNQGWNTAHNVYCNEDSGYIYPCGVNSGAGFGFLVYDLNGDPSDPQPVGSWNDHYAHDLYVVSYDTCPVSMPHPRFGLPCEIAFVFGGGAGLTIVDVTDKSNITTIVSNLTYPTLSYCHQGWLSEDRRYLFTDDELDELNLGVSSTTYIFNVEDLTSPFFMGSTTNGNAAIDHNLMVRGDYIFEANYVSGLRILDYSNINNVHEVGYFKTSLFADAPGFGGAWGVFSGLPSGVVLISDEQQGLFVLDPSPTVGCQTDIQCNDNDPCTIDLCENLLCSNTQVVAGTSCDDGDACTTSDACDAGGQCGGTEINTIPCTEDTVCAPATCDLGTGFCSCIPCTGADAPLDAGGFVTTKSRYFSIRAANPGVLTALRVTLMDLPAPFNAFNGETRWVGLPEDVSELAGSTDTTAPTVRIAQLDCNPVVADFASFGSFHVYGDAVLPGASFSVQATNKTCLDLGVANFSDPLPVETSRWCDLVGDCSSTPCSPPNGSVDMVFDVVALLDKFRNLPNSVSKVRADLSGVSPNRVIDILDINDAVAAFQGTKFPYAGPAACN